MRQEIVGRQNIRDHSAGLRKGQVVAASPMTLRDPMRTIVSTFRKVSTETDHSHLIFRRPDGGPVCLSEYAAP